MKEIGCVENNSKNKKRNPKKIITKIILCGFLLVILYLCFREVTNVDYKVEGASMLPTLKSGDLWTGKLCNTDHCRNFLKRGETVVVNLGSDGPITGEVIKRIIGLPLDTVTIADGNVYINGYKLIEEYTQGKISSNHGYNCISFYPGTDELVILGDNREHSWDARGFGVVKLSKVKAYASFDKYNDISLGPVISQEKLSIPEEECPDFSY